MLSGAVKAAPSKDLTAEHPVGITLTYVASPPLQTPQAPQTFISCTPVHPEWHMSFTKRDAEQRLFLESFQNQEKGLFSLKGSLAEDNHPQNPVQKNLEAHNVKQI